MEPVSSKMTLEGDKWSKMTFKDKTSYFYRNVTVEPMIGLLVIPSVFCSLVASNLMMDKACLVNLKFSAEICAALRARDTDHYKSEDAQVSQLVANMTTWTSLMTFFPVVLVMFAGSWSDRNKKRKPFMLAPIVGELLNCLSLIVCVYFFFQLPMEVCGFFTAFFPNIMGGWTIMSMAVFSYISDITTVEMRTVRIGFIDIFSSMGLPFGTALSGVMVKYVGYYGTFSIAAVFYITGLIYGSFHVKEADKVDGYRKSIIYTNNSEDEPQDLQTNKESSLTKPSVFSFFKDFFNISHIKNTFKVVFKEDYRGQRKKIILLIVVMIVVNGPVYGESAVMYLYMRYKYQWDAMDFSVFYTYSVIVHLIGASFSIGVFSHKMKMDDALLGIISCLSRVLSGILYAFAVKDWQVYMGPIVSILNGTSTIAMRSIASKLVPPHKLGKLNSMYGACEALAPLFYAPMYAFVYAHTINTFPGTFLLIGASLLLPGISIFGWIYIRNLKEKKVPEKCPENIT